MREDFLTLLSVRPPGAVLEIGCGTGDTGGAALQRGVARAYHGCELDPASAARAADALTSVTVGDVEMLDLPWPAHTFDTLLMSEVLEHLRDPWAAVRKVAATLKPGTLVLASSPNVTHHKILRALWRGGFTCTDVGPMDRTHLRWFTPRTYAAMFEDPGIDITRVRPRSGLGPKARWLNRLTLGRLPRHLFQMQVCVEGRKRG